MEDNSFFSESDGNVGQKQENPFLEFGGNIKQKEDNPFSEFGGSLKKKSTPVVSSGTPSQLPSQPDFLKQGASLADNSFLKEIGESAAQAVAQPSPQSKLPLEGFSQKQIDLLKKGVEKPVQSVSQKKSSGLVVPTNLPKQEAIAYENELKINNAAVNTLTDIYNKKGLKFDSSKPDAQKQIQEYVDKARNEDLSKVMGKDGKEYLVRSQGFFESAANSLVRSIKQPIESTEINLTDSPEKLADLLDKKIEEEPNVPEEAPSQFTGYFGELVGGLPKLIALTAIPYVGESAMVGEMYYNALANQRRTLYQRGLQEGMDRLSAAKKAMEVAPSAAIPDALVAAVMAKGVGGAGASVLPNAAKQSFIKAAGNNLKGVAKVSAVGGFSEYERSKIQQRAGYNVTDAEAIENTLRGAGDYALMDGAFKLMHSGPKFVSSAAKNLLSNIPTEILNFVAKQYPDGERTLEETKKFAETKAKVQDYVPEEKIASVTGLTEKTDNLKKDIKDLEEKKKNVPSSIVTEIDNQIKNKNKEVEFYDNQIKKVLESKDETGISEEIDDVTGLKIGEKFTPEEVKIGDEVQWTSQGTDQFAEPRKIKSISEDGKYAFVEGSDTGIPVAELSATKVKPTEAKNVEQLRAEEQAELDSKIPNAEQYRVEGKVDKSKLTNEEDIKAFDEVYNKYDKLISPLLEKPLEKSKPEEDEISVYHGGSVKDLSTTEGGLFVSADKNQAESYAKGNKGQVQEFKLNKNDISNEDNVREVINELGLKSKEEGWDLNDLMLHEIIDPRFETSLSEGDLNKLFKELDKRGYKAIEMLATDVSGKQRNVKDILVLNPKETLIEAKPTEAKTKEEYQKIKSNKKKKDFVRNNLPEEFKPLADELTEAQMSEIVDSNFDSKTIKNIQDAIQKQGAAEVLQPKQEGDGGTGGGRKRVEQGKQGDEPTGEGEAKAAEETQPKGAEEGKVKELKTNDKSILNRINSSENIPESVKEKFKDDLKYEVKSKEEAKSIAKNIIKEYGTDDAVTLAEANKFHGDVNSFIFSEAINDTYIKESEAKTPEEKLKYAEQWADYAIRFDESARSKGRFISAISDFYKKSPLGIKFVENERRNEDFKKWYKAKEGSYKEVFDELVQDPKFKSLIGEEVQKGLKEERAAQRQANRKKIEDFFENAKLKGNNLYAVPIPPKVINGALEIMKQSVLAGESVVNAVNKAIEHISKEVKDWDKEKFRKEYETKLSSIEGKAGKREKEELPEDAKNKILDKFRKKLKGLDESQKEQVIRKSFKQLVENGALEYNDFKKIIAETIGYGEVTPEEAAKITKLVSDINSVDDLAESIRNEGNRSEQNLLKYQKAKKEAEKSATELNKMVYNKTNVANRLMSIMQLNTLGIPSLVNNPIFNIWNQATVRFPNAVSMTVLDQILYGGSKVSNKLFGTGVLLPENNVLASQKEFFKKALQGGKLSTEQLFTGLTNKDYFQKEIYSSQIHPFTSIKDLWNWKFNGKSLTPAQVVDKSIQATVGLPAEIVARALNIGDKPQRFAAEGAQAAVFAKNLGLKDIDYKYFLEFPKEEAYRAFKKQGLSDDVAMKKAEEIQERIIKQGEESTFQQENLVNEVINSAVNIASSYGVGAGGVVKAIKTLNMPFLKIPLNASWSVYNLANPQVAFLQSAIYGARAIKSRSASDIQQSKKWLAHGATGIALTGIAGALVSNGIINASNRSDETSKKERQGEKTYEQQNSINVTKLNAYLRGENPDDVKNSLNVDLKWFGNVGNILNIEAIKKEEMTPEQRENGMSFMEDMFSGMSISSMELIENGVFSNTSGLLTAIDKGGNFADSYVLNLINMGTNIVQPAMFAQMSRAQLPYYSQQKADTFMEELKNNLLTRSSVLRSLSDKYPPSQIGVWGDRLDRKDNVAMKLFGISSNNNDNFAQPIYNDYKKTNNTAFLPPAVKPEVNGFELNVSQTNKLETLVGQARKNLVSPFVNDGAKLSGFKDKYSQLSEEDKVKALGIIYKMGYQVGEKQFTDLYPEFYKSDKKTPEQKKESKESSIFRKSLKKLIK
jgi:hypothetical protein